MLWTKAWLETRWRLLYGLVLPLITLALPYIAGGGANSVKEIQIFMGVMASFGIFSAAYLGSSGIKTQSPFAAMKGLHGSTHYTLSLPVSRFRLMRVRTEVGLSELAVVNTVAYTAVWLLFPLARGSSTPFDLFELIIAAIACTACFYFISVLLATFLDDPWQTFGAAFVAMVVWFIASRVSVPPRFNVFGFVGAASPLMTHSLPWPAMAISLIASVVLFLAALKIAERREY
jgi:hypothetical protein